MKIANKNWIRRFLTGVMGLSLIVGTMSPMTALAANTGSSILTYEVADGLDYDDTTTFADSDEAWAYADQIVDHVDSTVSDMMEIFSQRSVSIVDYGAVAHETFDIDGSTYKMSEEDAEAEAELAKTNTKAIYAAIVAVSEAGGGTVIVPAMDGQVFYTSAIHLEDNVNLYIEEGATLKFTTDTSLYQGDLMKEVYGDDVDDQGLTLTRFESVELMNYSPFIYAYGKTNIAITGEGTLDGSASKGDGSTPETMVWMQWKGTYTYEDGTKIQAQSAPRTKLFSQGQTDVPVSERQYGESESAESSGADDGFLRPNFIQPYNCQNVLISGVNIVNSPMWEINPVLCDTVLVEDVYINSHMNNNDGIDPECTSNMVIRECQIDVGDDCVAIKSGRNGDGLRIDRASFNIVIENNTFVDGHGGVTIGSEITAGAKNIFSRNNEMDSDELQCAYRFKTNYIRGGVIENIYYKDDTVKMVQSSKPVILVDLNYDISSEVKMMETMDVSYTAYIPEFKNVLIENLIVNADNVSGNGGKYAFQLNGFSVDSIADSCTVLDGTEDCYVTDFTIKNSTFIGCTQAFNMNYVDGLTLENVTITGSTTADSISNVRNLTLLDSDFTNSAITRSAFEEAVTEGLTITNCLFDEDEDTDLNGLVEEDDGSVYYYVDGVVQSDYTGLIKDADTGKWYYVVNGQVDFNTTGLVKHSSGAYWYVVDGVMQSDYTGLVKHTTGSWWYVVNGKVQSSYIGLAKHSTGSWWYVVDGRMQSSYTGLAKHSTGSWWYVVNGKAQTSFTGIAKHSTGSQWYVVSGKAQMSYTGKVTYNGTTYRVVNGKVA